MPTVVLNIPDLAILYMVAYVQYTVKKPYAHLMSIYLSRTSRPKLTQEKCSLTCFIQLVAFSTYSIYSYITNTLYHVLHNHCFAFVASGKFKC